MQTGRGFHHIDSLDGVRGLAAAIVLIGHTHVALVKSPEVLDLIRQSPLAVLINGYGAVHLFFILSGFCLASSAARCHSRWELLQYFVRRVFRIHPPFMFALLVAWCASFFYDVSNSNGGLSRWIMNYAHVHLAPAELLRFLTYPGTAGNQLPAAWSMAVEMLFSFLLPAMMWLVLRTHWAVVLVVCLYPVLRDGFQPGILKYGLYFSIGLALYEERERLGHFFDRFGPVAAAVFVLLALGFFASPVALALFFKKSGPILSAIGGTAIVCAAIFLPGLRSFLSSRPLVHFGRISYSFYLFHLTVLLLAVRMIEGPAGIGDALLLLGVSLVVTTACAEIGYRLVERPSIAAGNAICRRLAARTGASAQLSSLLR